MSCRALLLAAGLVLTGTFTAAAAQPSIYCESPPAIQFDPAKASSPSDQFATYGTIYNRLFKLQGGQIVPDLASKWVTSLNGLSVTVQLREDVPFQSTDWFKPRRDVDASDVLFSFKRQLDPTNPFYAGLDNFDGILRDVTQVDDRTVTFELNRADPDFLARLAGNAGGILSSEYATHLLDDGRVGDLATKPVGTGPYQLDQYRQGGVLSYLQFPEYFDPQDQRLKPPPIVNWQPQPNVKVKIPAILGPDCILTPFDIGNPWVDGIGRDTRGWYYINVGGNGTGGTSNGPVVPVTGDGGAGALASIGQRAPVAAAPRLVADSEADKDSSGLLEGVWPRLYSPDPERTYPSFPRPTEAAIAALQTELPNPVPPVETDDAFVDDLNARAKDLADHPIGIGFFRYGFADAVLIKTDKDSNQVCSGTMLRGGYVVTVWHCVDHLDNGGGLYLVDAAADACLARTPTSPVHPADRCGLRPLKVLARPIPQDPTDDSSLALVKVELPPGFARFADINGVYSSPNPVLTFTGFGRTSRDPNPQGTLQVGWGRASIPTGHAADPTYTFKMLNNIGTTCTGDSGGGVLRGRLFGYGGGTTSEMHYLFAVIATGPKTCNPKPELVSMTIVSTQTPAALDWLCTQTDNALTACEWKIKQVSTLAQPVDLFQPVVGE